MNDNDRFEDDLSSTPGALVGALAQHLLIGAVMLFTSPVWVPLLVIHKIQHWNDPKPKYRGTVRPLGGPIR